MTRIQTMTFVSILGAAVTGLLVYMTPGAEARGSFPVVRTRKIVHKSYRSLRRGKFVETLTLRDSRFGQTWGSWIHKMRTDSVWGSDALAGNGRTVRTFLGNYTHLMLSNKLLKHWHVKATETPAVRIPSYALHLSYSTYPSSFTRMTYFSEPSPIGPLQDPMEVSAIALRSSRFCEHRAAPPRLRTSYTGSPHALILTAPALRSYYGPYVPKCLALWADPLDPRPVLSGQGSSENCKGHTGQSLGVAFCEGRELALEGKTLFYPSGGNPSSSATATANMPLSKRATLVTLHSIDGVAIPKYFGPWPRTHIANWPHQKVIRYGHGIAQVTVVLSTRAPVDGANIPLRGYPGVSGITDGLWSELSLKHNGCYVRISGEHPLKLMAQWVEQSFPSRPSLGSKLIYSQI